MLTNIQNMGFISTKINDHNENIRWIGEYDGKNANIDLLQNINGLKDHYHIQLDNNDIGNILGIQPVLKPLEKRLIEDFNVPVALEGMFKRRKSRINRNKKRKMRTKTRKYRKY